MSASYISTTSFTTEKIIRHSLDNAMSTLEKLHKELTKKGYNFLRNYTIENYKFDFYCPVSKVAIEIDSYTHESYDIYNQDATKKLCIPSLGITVLRYTDYQILIDMDEILRNLKNNHVASSVTHTANKAIH
ncbi:endonuclease domain-containing protein [Aquimarina hainanensis]|uniref:Endonuclease domain-containing protein n=1 Tax=Aquimarina hainanensis TaxID=1578017 RepID=A0ABW5N7X3_9FLAO